jgi:hypothetical protein
LTCAEKPTSCMASTKSSQFTCFAATAAVVENIILRIRIVGGFTVIRASTPAAECGFSLFSARKDSVRNNVASSEACFDLRFDFDLVDFGGAGVDPHSV